MAIKKFIRYTHVDIEIDTVGEFCDPTSISIAKDISVTDFLLYAGGTGKANIERIWDSYTNQAERDVMTPIFADSNRWGEIYFKKNTVVLIPIDKAFREILAISGKNQVTPDFSYVAFFGRQLNTLLCHPDYKPVYQYTGSGFNQVYNTDYPNITVWMWCRALSTQVHKELKGDFIDVSPFITDLNIAVGKGGGTFSFNIAPVSDNVLKELGYEFYEIAFLNKLFNRDASLRYNPFFHKYINTNDLVFIRFETLKIERRSKKKKNIGFSDLPNQIYDMIGLVDSNAVSTSPMNNDLVISIVGRDLMKLLIEDASYFYPTMFAENLYTNIPDQNKIIQRLLVSGQYNHLIISKRYQSISVLLRFIINQLSNMGVVPDSLFKGYANDCDVFGTKGDRRSYIYRLDEKVPRTITITTTTVTPLNPAPLTPGSGGATPAPSLPNQIGLGEIKIITSTPTTGNATGQPAPITPMKPYTVTSITDSYEEFLPVKSQLANGLWQIMKLVIDKNVSYRRIQDGSISQPDGSFLNQFYKICQEPFVEFFGDTYGDLYHLVARIPPYSKDSILDFIGRKNLSNKESTDKVGATKNTAFSRSPIVIEIEEGDVVNDNLYFNEENIYSWYQITPKANFIGMASSVAMGYLPAVFFPIYADIWGNKKFEIPTNYIPYSGVVGSGGGISRDSIIKQMAEDLRFLIEIYSYSPFVRKGTITINGDRRIKRGTFIKFQPTGEIFYVDGVANNYSINSSRIDRTTILEVKNGMMEEYIRETHFTKKGDPITYFSIVDTEYIKETIIKRLTADVGQPVKIKENFGVNMDVFNYFFKRQQFSLKNGYGY